MFPEKYEVHDGGSWFQHGAIMELCFIVMALVAMGCANRGSRMFLLRVLSYLINSVI